MRLLRDLPEAEPPAELRRRIGAALMDVERAAPRHRLELAWLPRPRAPGWAWGGALGAAAAAVVLLATRGPAPAPRVAAAPQLPPAGFAAPSSPVRPPSGFEDGPGFVGCGIEPGHARRAAIGREDLAIVGDRAGNAGKAW